MPRKRAEDDSDEIDSTQPLQMPSRGGPPPTPTRKRLPTHEQQHINYRNVPHHLAPSFSSDYEEKISQAIPGASSSPGGKVIRQEVSSCNRMASREAKVVQDEAQMPLALASTRDADYFGETRMMAGNNNKDAREDGFPGAYKMPGADQQAAGDTTITSTNHHVEDETSVDSMRVFSPVEAFKVEEGEEGLSQDALDKQTEEMAVATAEKDSMWAFLRRSRCAQIATFFGCFLIVGLTLGLVLAFFNRSIEQDGQDSPVEQEFFDQIGPHLDGPLVEAQHGSSISLNADGTRMAVADSKDVYLYDLEEASDGTMEWVFAATIHAPENATLGEQTHRHNMVRSAVQVDLSQDGNFIAVGWPYSANEEGLQPSIGRVEVYREQEEGIWTRLGDVMYGWSTADFFGTSISLSGTGGTVAVGAPGNDGHADIFLLNQGRWVKQGDFVALDGTLLAGSVSIDRTGQTFAVGGHPVSEDGAAAVVRIFRFTAGNWAELGGGIVGNFQDTAYIAALSADGNIVAVSNYYRGEAGPKKGELNDALDVRAFQWNGQDWVQLGENLHGFAPGEKSGYFITLSDDGSLMGMGDPGRENQAGGGVAGHAHIYQYNPDAGEWQQRGPNKDGEAPGDQFGFAVSLSGDGTKFAVGAPFNRGEGIERGRVSVYAIEL